MNHRKNSVLRVKKKQVANLGLPLMIMARATLKRNLLNSIM
jgi:hypothetical protein